MPLTEEEARYVAKLVDTRNEGESCDVVFRRALREIPHLTVSDFLAVLQTLEEPRIPRN
ncbi:MAG: hypothetical protein AAGF48_11855 [Pseudomonadota bacterium]